MMLAITALALLLAAAPCSADAGGSFADEMMGGMRDSPMGTCPSLYEGDKSSSSDDQMAMCSWTGDCSDSDCSDQCVKNPALFKGVDQALQMAAASRMMNAMKCLTLSGLVNEALGGANTPESRRLLTKGRSSVLTVNQIVRERATHAVRTALVKQSKTGQRPARFHARLLDELPTGNDTDPMAQSGHADDGEAHFKGCPTPENVATAQPVLQAMIAETKQEAMGPGADDEALTLTLVPTFRAIMEADDPAAEITRVLSEECHSAEVQLGTDFSMANATSMLYFMYAADEMEGPAEMPGMEGMNMSSSGPPPAITACRPQDDSDVMFVGDMLGIMMACAMPDSRFPCTMHVPTEQCAMGMFGDNALEANATLKTLVEDVLTLSAVLQSTCQNHTTEADCKVAEDTNDSLSLFTAAVDALQAAAATSLAEGQTFNITGAPTSTNTTTPTSSSAGLFGIGAASVLVTVLLAIAV